MSSSTTSKLAMVGWVFAPYIMLPIYLVQNLESLKAGDSGVRMKAVGGAVWALVVIGMLVNQDPPPPKAPATAEKAAEEKPKAEAAETSSPATPAAKVEEKEAAVAKEEPTPTEEAAPAQEEKAPVVEVEPACGEIAKKASGFWHVAEPVLREPCGDRPHEEFALIEWKKCAKEKAAEIKAAEKEYKELTKRSFEVIKPEEVELGPYREDKSAFIIEIPGLLGFPKVALTKPEAVFNGLANASLVRDHNCVGFPWEWQAPNHSVHVAVPYEDGPDFKKRHVPKKSIWGDKYHLGACVSYTHGNTKKHSKKENNCGYGTLPGEKKKIDMGAGKVIMAKEVEVLVWSIPDKKILLDTAAK